MTIVHVCCVLLQCTPYWYFIPTLYSSVVNIISTYIYMTVVIILFKLMHCYLIFISLIIQTVIFIRDKNARGQVSWWSLIGVAFLPLFICTQTLFSFPFRNLARTRAKIAQESECIARGTSGQ